MVTGDYRPQTPTVMESSNGSLGTVVGVSSLVRDTYTLTVRLQKWEEVSGRQS